MNAPIAMAFDPTGRLFYTEKATGRVRLFANGQLQPTAVITLAVDSNGERGLLGITVDPDFATNHYIWVYRTNPNPLTNQVVRFEEYDGIGINPAVVFTTPLLGATNHNGGNLHFGPDGKLYVTIGENAIPSNSQSGDTPLGHIHRFNPTVPLSAPPDNPFYNNITVTVKSIWTFGNRNSFDFDFDPLSQWMFSSENGPNCDDELNRSLAGYNYGWRDNYPCDDTNPDPHYNNIPPLWFLPLGNCCVAPTGVAFYTGGQIPAWQNELFMCSYNDGWLRHFYLSPDRTTVTAVAQVEGVICNTDIQTGPDGAFYYIEGGGYSSGTLKRIVADATPTPTSTLTQTPTATPTGTPTPGPSPTPLPYRFYLPIEMKEF